MSLVYKLVVADPLPAAQALATVATVPGFTPHDGGLDAVDMVVSAGPPSALDTQIVDEEFGFRARCQIGIRLKKNQDALVARDRLVRSCKAVLANTSGDAVLLFNSEVVVLVRRAGVLVANDLPGFWSPGLLALIGNPPLTKIGVL